MEWHSAQEAFVLGSDSPPSIPGVAYVFDNAWVLVHGLWNP